MLTGQCPDVSSRHEQTSWVSKYAIYKVDFSYAYRSIGRVSLDVVRPFGFYT